MELLMIVQALILILMSIVILYRMVAQMRDDVRNYMIRQEVREDMRTANAGLTEEIEEELFRPEDLSDETREAIYYSDPMDRHSKDNVNEQ